jgi:hypothetical protein
MNKLSTLILVVCSLLIAGCDKSVPPVIEHVANAKKLADGSYEVQLRYSVTTSGGPCLSSSSFRSTTGYATNWLYLKSIEQTASADQVIVTTDEGARDLAIKDMRGTISFDNGAMTVQLEQPHVLPSGAVQGYAPYYLNGTYQIAR